MTSRFSLSRTVAEMVAEIGPSTADDLLPQLAPDGFTRLQVRRALQNATANGWLTCKLGKRFLRGCEPGVYSVAEVKQKPPEKSPPLAIRVVNSVWQLAEVA